MLIFGRIEALESSPLHGEENSMHQVRVDGENSAIYDAVRVTRENAKNLSAKARALLKSIISNRDRLFTFTPRQVKV